MVSEPGVSGADTVDTRTVDEAALARGELRAMDGYPHEWAGAFPTPATETAPKSMTAAGPFAAALAELALTVRRHHTPDGPDDIDALAVITEGAVALIDGTEHAAVVVPAANGTLTALAAHGALPPLIMGIQNELGVGPCLDAVAQTGQLLAGDLTTDPRWPACSGRIEQWNVTSILCTPLALPGEVLGSLTLASSRPNAFDAEAVELAAVFAAHATLAVSNRRIARNLSAMAGSRDIIGQAKGILMERHRMTASQAFATLTRLTQHHNIKLRALSEHLIATGDLPA